MNRDSAHFAEIMDEVERLGVYLRDHCPEVDVRSLENLAQMPSNDDLARLNSIRVGQLLKEVSHEA